MINWLRNHHFLHDWEIIKTRGSNGRIKQWFREAWFKGTFIHLDLRCKKCGAYKKNSYQYFRKDNENI